MKWIVLIGFVLIIGALGSALLHMMRDGRDGAPKTNRMVRALAWRVGLSITLFLILLLSYQLGWIQPTGLPVAR